MTGLLGVVVAYQVLAQMRFRPDEMQVSYWLVTYDYGFVRRGLGGEIIQLLSGRADRVPTWLTYLAPWSAALLPAIALYLVIAALVRHGTRSSVALAMLLACSPWTFDALIAYGRPDQFGLVWLITVGAVLLPTRGRPPALVAVLTVLGLAGGVLTLVHEASMGIWGIVVLVLIAVADTAPRTKVWESLTLFIPVGGRYWRSSSSDVRIQHWCTNSRPLPP
ncbi:hypothetical protein [Raineyella fluvialis]|uniref:Uncharacterized protein n=1 Tax=Raineyella fluvialis TaxID=2662261 RepID=A0A5Q2FAY3_9ACTN|nr:hypothetical protein [Raineyella fluvialis]QGF23868.1 hypothetical protein Rai3103_09475 [Raineyella fluvialis]